MIKKEPQTSTVDRAYDAEQILRYFVKRDAMNAEVHLEDHVRGLNVRFSPITIAAERVFGFLWREAYGEEYPPTIEDLGLI